ncbi:ribonuclease Y [Candidatus Uhrbacteria bacterium]|nr:ribonuclease Y [Candidatus Uhrbacteria bacterium]
MNLTTIVVPLLTLAAGTGAGYALRKQIALRHATDAAATAERLIEEAKQKAHATSMNAQQEASEILIKAKERAFSQLEEVKREEATLRREIQDAQKRMEKREETFDQKILDLEQKKQQLEDKLQFVEQTKTELARAKDEHVERLEAVAHLSQEDALAQLHSHVEGRHTESLLSRIRKLEQTEEEEIEKQSRRVLSMAITRFASSVCAEHTTSVVELPNDEMKGRIIGKEGRNIKAIEHLTGTEIIVDETPSAITISGFSPIRRQVAKRALEDLIKDGRIQPARIEEAVNEAKLNLAKEVRKAGEEALYQCGIPVSSVDPKLTSILGRMRFRTSYGQNALMHSIEVSTLSGMIAEELGADVFICKKGGLFHDIGKAVDHDMQGAHPEIGYNIMRKFGFPEEIAYQSIAHHEDKPRTIEGAIVKAADAISGSRPGARRQSVEQFIQRMEQLEKTAMGFTGVEKAYAIQAGREVRVFVKPEEIDDLTAYKLAQDVAQKIEAELTYPGEVKVTVIRETRVCEYAR